MKVHEAVDTANVVGIKNQNGSIKCRACMADEDWEKLTPHNVITLQNITEGGEWIYCDYCEKRL